MLQPGNMTTPLYDKWSNQAEVETLQEETQEDHLAEVDGDQPVIPSEEVVEEGETLILTLTMPLNKEEEENLEEKNQ